MDVSIGLAFLAGLVSFLSPCVLPLVPAYIGYMGGQMTNTVAAQVSGGGHMTVQVTLTSRLSTLLHGIAFVFGFTLIFVALGLATTAFLNLVGGQNVRLITDILARAGGVFIILMGLHVMGILPKIIGRLKDSPTIIGSVAFTLAFLLIVTLIILWALGDPLIALPALAALALWLVLGGAFSTPATFWTRTFNSIQTGLYADTRLQMTASGQQNYVSSAFLGIVFAAGWTPCIGPIYGSILTMAAAGGDVGQAGVQLMAYSFGLGIPFLIAALMMDGAKGAVRRLQRHMQTIKRVSGALLIIIGIAIATGRMQEISRDFASRFADFSYQLEHCVLSIAQGERPLGEFGLCLDSGNTETAEPA